MYQYLLRLFHIFLFITIGMSVFSQIPKGDSAMTDYPALWRKVDSLNQEGLMRSALEEVENIYAIASEEDSSLELVKALIYKVKYQSVIEENSESLGIDQFKKAILETQTPAQQILHTYLAKLYWQHYQSNRWEIMDRTSLSVVPEDFLTWDASQYHREITYHFMAAIEPAEMLQMTGAREVEYILETSDSSLLYRPTLFDILAHEALVYFTSEESQLTQPVDKFEMQAQEVLVEASRFVRLAFQSTDTLSQVYLTTNLYQQLLDFHLQRNESTPYAIVDLDLKRLSFLKDHVLGENAEELYENVLREISRSFEDHPAVGEAYYELANVHFKRASKYNPLVSEDYRWERKEARDICMAVIEKFPDSRGSLLCHQLKKRIEMKGISLEVEDVNLPNEPSLSKLTFRNVDTVYFRLVQAPQQQSNPYNYDKKKLLDLLKRQKVHEEWMVDLPEVNDYQQHSTEIKINKQDPGSYVLLVSDHVDFTYEGHYVAYAWTQFSNISYFHRINPETGRLEVYVRERGLGKPIEGVSIQAYEWDYDKNQYIAYGVEAATDANGYAAFEAPRDYHTLELELSTSKDQYRTKGLYAYAYRRDTPSTLQIRTHFFTDRKIYRPGQTIFFKGIVLERDADQHRIKSGYPVEVSLWDVNSQKVSEVELTTNDYGTFSGSFTAPATGLLGNMSIKTQGGSTSFSIEEYKRPNFEVRFDSLQRQYQLDDTTSITGLAETFSGIAVDGAKVSYRVVRRAIFPYWRGIYRWRPVPNSTEREIVNGITTTGEDGQFKIKFPLIPDPSLPREGNPMFLFEIHADVTDQTGETHSQKTTVKAGYVPLIVNINLPDRIDNQAPGMLHVESEYLLEDGNPIRGTLSIYKLNTPEQAYRPRRWKRPDLRLMSKEEFKDSFPDIPYDQEDDYRSWERAGIAAKFDFDARESRDLPLDNLKDAEPGKYVAAFIALNGEVKILNYFTLMDQSSRKAPLPVVLDAFLDKPTALPGEEVTYTLMTSEKKIWVLYEMEQDGQLLDKKLIKLKGKRKHEEKITIQEHFRGNVTVSATAIYHNQFEQEPTTIRVPWSNKELALEWSTFRSELQPGDQDEWRVTIKGNKGEKVAAEMVATLYDASLDAFRSNYFDLSLYPSYYRKLNWNGADGFGTQYAQELAQDWNPVMGLVRPRIYDALSGFGLFYGRYPGEGNYYRRSYAMEQSVAAMAAPSSQQELRESDTEMMDDAYTPAPEESTSRAKEEPVVKSRIEEIDFSAVNIRSNFSETAFFYPHLMTNESGEVVLSFTIPEALTKWKFLGLAHTKDLEIGTLTGELVTRKKLMVKPNFPRFLRAGDKVVISSRISNMSEETLTGSAELRILDAYTMEPLDDRFQFYQGNKTFMAKAGENLALTWEVTVPEGIQAVVVQVVAQAGDFSDGEEHVLPILKNRMLVTESLPLAIRGESEKIYSFDKLQASDTASTLTHHQLTLEFTSNPVWYAVQALPYLMEFPYDCTEQIFSRYYAHSLASHIANSDPAIQRVFERWKQVDESSGQQSLVSNLEKNEELKGLLIRETPWLLNANSETERKKRLGVLFDLNRMSNELQRTYRQLQERQYSNGGFSWFPGMPPSRYITQLIATGVGHLQHLGIDNPSGDAETGGMMNSAVSFLDQAIGEDYQLLKQYGANLAEDQLGNIQIQYLYMRSFFTEIPMAQGTQEAYDYYYSQAKKFWLEKNHYMQGMIALAVSRNGEEEIPTKIIRSLAENAVMSEELGMYWKDLARGFYWYQNDIEKQALLIEAFEEIAEDKKLVEEMKIWLLKNKQTNDWETTRATVAACNALIQSGVDLLSEQQSVEISMGDMKIDPTMDEEISMEAGTGYFKKNWPGDAIDSSLGAIQVKKTTQGIAWGAVYWQYFEQLDKITFAETPLSIVKGLYSARNSASGPKLEPLSDSAVFEPGDKVVVRIEIRVDRDMEYVHMKDMRAAGFEPVNVFSQYKVRGGLGYYESTRDAATHFFFEYLPKGTHVFEYPLRATHSGDYSNGITTIQCMYAPAFTSHSEGVRVEIGRVAGE